MPSPTSLLMTLHYTPAWVWALLAALVAVGLSQTRPRRIGLRRAALLPAAMLAWSLWSVVAGFGSALALGAWTVGVLVAASATALLGAQRGARWQAGERRFELPGSWAPLALIVALFCAKFVVGASLAQHPLLRADAAFATGASLAFGAFSGVFAGRALALLRLAQGDARVVAG